MRYPQLPAGLKTTEEWLSYFRSNQSNLRLIPWGRDTTLTDAERSDIADSIRIFQLGESSEGRHFIRAAREYALSSGNCFYPDALRLFIAEEQRHARDLGRFMKSHDIPVATRQWTDTIFRKLRKLLNLEVCIVVLVTAELIARIYYRALRNATQSPVLKSICAQVLSDETMHVRFQVGTLSLLRMKRPVWKSAPCHALQSLLFLGTLPVVWLDHRRVFRAGGYSFRRFWTRCWTVYLISLRYEYRTHEVLKALKTLGWTGAGMNKRLALRLDPNEMCTEQNGNQTVDYLNQLRVKCEQITIELQAVLRKIAEMERTIG